MRSHSSEQLLWGAFLIFLFLLSWTTIADYDFWWHLNLGRQIWLEGSPKVADAFSFTFSGQPQSSAEWLADLIFYLTYSAGGIPAVNVLKFLLLAATFYGLRRASQELLPDENDRSFLAIIIALVVILFAMRFRLFVRPFLFSYLFMALFFWILPRYSRVRDVKLLWLLPVLQIVWANTSKGAFFGPLLVALWIFFDVVGRRLDKKLVAVFAGVLLASLASPEIFGLYRMLWSYTPGEEQVLVGEHQPLSFMLLWGGGFGYTWGFQLLTLFGLLYLLGNGRRDIRGWLLFVLFFVPAIKMVRMIDFFSLASIFFVIPLLARVARLPVVDRVWKMRFSQQGLAVVLVVLGAVSVVTSRSYAFGSSAKPESIPAGAVEFLREKGLAGRIFNSFPFGGYVAWKLPDSRIFIDGRMIQLFPHSFLKHYFDMIHTPRNFAAEQEKWGFDIAVLEYDRLSGGRHFPGHLAENPEWALVYWDNHSLLYLKRNERFEGVIADHEYRIFRPTFNEFKYLDDKLNGWQAKQLVLDARHDKELNPQNQEPRLAYVYLLYSLGMRQYTEEIVRELEACIKLKPDFAMEYSALGLILLQTGRRDEAASLVKRALELDPEDKGGLLLKERLGKG